MPIYDYKCKDCKKTFLVHQTLEQHEKKPLPPCEKCGSKNVDRQITGISVVTSKKS